MLIGLEGLQYKEVAHILGVPVGTVRSRLSRGRGEMRRQMTDAPKNAGRIESILDSFKVNLCA